MKKVFTSLLLLTVALCSWGQESGSDPNPKFEDGTLTITYEAGMDFNNILEDSWKGNVTTLKLVGNFSNDFFNAGGPAENLINQCTNSTLYLDLENCTGVVSKVVSTTGSEKIDWSDTNNYKYTVPNVKTVEEKTEWYLDEEFTKKVPYSEERVYKDGDKWYWTGWDGDTPQQVYPNTIYGYTQNGNFTQVDESQIDENGQITLSGEGTSFNFDKFKEKLNGVTFPKNNPNFNAIPVGLLTNQSQLTKVVLSDGILSVGMNAFQGNEGLAEIDFGNTVQNFDESAFERCGITGQLTIPASVIEVKTMAFKACSKVTDVIFPEDAAIEHIYQFAFAMENPDQSSLKNVYVNCDKYIVCDKGAFGFTSTDGQTQAGTVTTRLYYPANYYEKYVGAYKTEILGGIFEKQEQRLANRNYARAENSVTGIDGETYYNTDYPNGNGWWEFLSTGIPVPYNPDWKVDYNDYWRTYSDIVDLTVPEGFAENSDNTKGINVYLVSGYDKESGKAQLVRMKVGECIPANTGVVIHWRVKVTDTTGGFIFFAPYICEEGESYLPYDNEKYPNNKYKDTYDNYMKPLNTRGETVTVKNVEKKNGKALYRNFFWGNSEEFTAESAQSYKGEDFDKAGVSGWGFYRAVTNGYKVNNKAFLHFPASIYDNNKGAGSGENHETDTNANAFSFSIVGEETNGITNLNVNTTVTNDSYYTLQGVKLNAPAERGIYIHNGKKIILK